MINDMIRLQPLSLREVRSESSLEKTLNSTERKKHHPESDLIAMRTRAFIPVMNAPKRAEKTSKSYVHGLDLGAGAGCSKLG